MSYSSNDWMTLIKQSRDSYKLAPISKTRNRTIFISLHNQNDEVDIALSDIKNMLR